MGYRRVQTQMGDAIFLEQDLVMIMKYCNINRISKGMLTLG